MVQSSSSTRRLLRTAMALLAFAAAQSQAGDYATAARQHQEQRWSGAYARFLVAGRQGDPAAAEAALFMHRYGTLLYRTQWDLSGEESEDLQRAASRRSRGGEKSVPGPAPQGSRQR